MANLKFYKMAQAPVGTTEKPLEAGAIWFNTTNHSIEVYSGSAWSAFSGVLDAVVENEKLTVTKYDGSKVSVDFSVYATDEALELLTGRVSTLEGTVAGHGESISGLSGRMTTVEGKASAAEGKLAGLTGTVVEDIAAAVLAEENRAKGVEGGLDTRLGTLETKVNTDHEGRIAGLEAKFTGEDSVADQIADAVAAAEGRVQAKLDNKVETSVYNAYVSANDERVAAVEKEIDDEVLRATGAEAAINAKIGGSYGTEEGQITVAADIQAAKDAAAEAQRTIDEFLTGEGIDPNKVENLKEIVKYIEDHGAEYSALVEDLGDLSDAIDTLNGKVDVTKVSEAIATAKGEAVSSANGYTDEKIAAEVLRADGKYEEKGVAAGLVSGLAEGAVATNASAISALQGQVGTGTVDSRIATAKSEAIEAAGQAADQKIADLKLDETYEKVGEAKKLVDALANGAVAGNTAAIAALDAKVAEGLAWVTFE